MLERSGRRRWRVAVALCAALLALGVAWACQSKAQTARTGAGRAGAGTTGPAALKIVEHLRLGRGVEAERLRYRDKEYLIVRAEPAARIDVLLMNSEEDRFSSFPELEAQLARRKQRLLWAMNGGMYHLARNPVGLLVSHAQTRSALNTQTGYGNFYLEPNGVFALTEAGPRILSTQAFRARGTGDARVLEATQSGPLLLLSGKFARVFDANSNSRVTRNGVAITQQNQILFAISSDAVSFHEFASALIALGCRDALYLDGSISAAYVPKLGRKDSGEGLGPVIVLSEASD